MYRTYYLPLHEPLIVYLRGRERSRRKRQKRRQTGRCEVGPVKFQLSFSFSRGLFFGMKKKLIFLPCPPKMIFFSFPHLFLPFMHVFHSFHYNLLVVFSNFLFLHIIPVFLFSLCIFFFVLKDNSKYVFPYPLPPQVGSVFSDIYTSAFLTDFFKHSTQTDF